MMDESIGPGFLGLVIAVCQTPQHTSDKKPTSVSFANELQLHVTRNWPIYESVWPGTGGTCISDVLPAFLSPLTLSSNNNVKDRKIDSRKERQRNARRERETG